MAWYAKPRRARKPSTANYVALDPAAVALSRVASSLLSRLAFAEKTDPTVRRLTARLKELSTPPKNDWHPTTPMQVYRYDLRAGRTASWYNAEAEALAADLEHVIRVENRRLLQGELERARREAHARVCRSFRPLLALPEEQRSAVLLSLGIDPGVLEDGEGGRAQGLPTRAAGRWSVTVRAPKAGDGWEPDGEVLEALEEEASRGVDESTAGGRLRKAGFRYGEAPLITYGSSGGDWGSDD